MTWECSLDKFLVFQLGELWNSSLHQWTEVVHLKNRGILSTFWTLLGLAMGMRSISHIPKYSQKSFKPWRPNYRLVTLNVGDCKGSFFHPKSPVIQVYKWHKFEIWPDHWEETGRESPKNLSNHLRQEERCQVVICRHGQDATRDGFWSWFLKWFWDFVADSYCCKMFLTIL